MRLCSLSGGIRRLLQVYGANVHAACSKTTLSGLQTCNFHAGPAFASPLTRRVLQDSAGAAHLRSTTQLGPARDDGTTHGPAGTVALDSTCAAAGDGQPSHFPGRAASRVGPSGKPHAADTHHGTSRAGTSQPGSWPAYMRPSHSEVKAQAAALVEQAQHAYMNGAESISLVPNADGQGSTSLAAALIALDMLQELRQRGGTAHHDEAFFVFSKRAIAGEVHACIRGGWRNPHVKRVNNMLMQLTSAEYQLADHQASWQLIAQLVQQVVPHAGPGVLPRILENLMSLCQQHRSVHPLAQLIDDRLCTTDLLFLPEAEVARALSCFAKLTTIPRCYNALGEQVMRVCKDFPTARLCNTLQSFLSLQKVPATVHVASLFDMLFSEDRCRDMRVGTCYQALYLCAKLKQKGLSTYQPTPSALNTWCARFAAVMHDARTHVLAAVVRSIAQLTDEWPESSLPHESVKHATLLRMRTDVQPDWFAGLMSALAAFDCFADFIPVVWRFTFDLAMKVSQHHLHPAVHAGATCRMSLDSQQLTPCVMRVMDHYAQQQWTLSMTARVMFYVGQMCDGVAAPTSCDAALQRAMGNSVVVMLTITSPAYGCWVCRLMEDAVHSNTEPRRAPYSAVDLIAACSMMRYRPSAEVVYELVSMLQDPPKLTFQRLHHLLQACNMLCIMLPVTALQNVSAQLRRAVANQECTAADMPSVIYALCSAYFANQEQCSVNHLHDLAQLCATLTQYIADSQPATRNAHPTALTALLPADLMLQAMNLPSMFGTSHHALQAAAMTGPATCTSTTFPVQQEVCDWLVQHVPGCTVTCQHAVLEGLRPVDVMLTLPPNQCIAVEVHGVHSYLRTKQTQDPQVFTKLTGPNLLRAKLLAHHGVKTVHVSAEAWKSAMGAERSELLATCFTSDAGVNMRNMMTSM